MKPFTAVENIKHYQISFVYRVNINSNRFLNDQKFTGSLSNQLKCSTNKQN